MLEVFASTKKNGPLFFFIHVCVSNSSQHYFFSSVSFVQTRKFCFCQSCCQFCFFYFFFAQQIFWISQFKRRVKKNKREKSFATTKIKFYQEKNLLKKENNFNTRSSCPISESPLLIWRVSKTTKKKSRWTIRDEEMTVFFVDRISGMPLWFCGLWSCGHGRSCGARAEPKAILVTSEKFQNFFFFFEIFK